MLDYRTRRIPNWLVLTGLAIALLLRAFQGADAITAGLIGAGIGLGVGYTLFALGVFGGGDGKLLMAVGAYFGGPDAILGALLAIALAGGVLGIIWSVREGVILPVLLNTGQTLKYLLTFGRAGSLRTGSRSHRDVGALRAGHCGRFAHLVVLGSAHSMTNRYGASGRTRGARRWWSSRWSCRSS